MKTVLVLFGGKSSEYEVSLNSAYFVIRNIPDDKYNIVKVGITKEGKWLLFEDDIDMLPNNTWQSGKCRDVLISQNYGDKYILAINDGQTEKIHIDVCFPVLHGKNGEDGTLQGLFEISGIPFVGCEALSSGMCMDKSVTNMAFDAAEIPQAKWLSSTYFDYKNNKDAFADKCISYLGLPLFIKPANAGSSVGISKVKTREQFFEAMTKAFKEDRKIVAEECINGREIECAVLGNDEPIASVLGEVVPCNEFYDYDAKYIDNDSALDIPAKMPENLAEEIRCLAIRAFKTLDCKGLSRVDFFLRKSDNKPMINEINTLPGFTSISMFPMLFEKSGFPKKDLIDKLINLALE